MISNLTQLLQASRTFVVLVAIGLFAMAARGVTDPDVWWHLRTGELITSTHSVPHTDPYSFTRFGQPWINHEWLSDVFIYNLYRAGGWGGLIVVFAAITAAAFMLVYLRSPGRPFVAAAVTVWGAIASAPTWGVRPQMISLLLASVFLFLLERSEKQPRTIWWTVPITLLWVNLHAGYALGIALLLLYIIGDAVEWALGQRSRTETISALRPLGLATLACIAVVPLNPNGIRMYGYPLETLRSGAMQNYISEWFSPNFHQSRFAPFMLMILAVIAVCALRRNLRARTILLLAVTLWGALHSIRHIPIFVLVAVPVLSAAIQPWWSSRSTSPAQDKTPPAKLAFNAVLLASFVIFTLVRVHTVLAQQPKVEGERFPAAAVAYIAEHRPPAPVLSHYNWGGYLIWKLYPEYRVFIDGRADLYGDEFMDRFRDLVYLGGNSLADLNSSNINTVLLPPDTPLTLALPLTGHWTEIYRDPLAVILVRNQGI